MGKNIARVQSMMAEGQALVDTLCRRPVHRTYLNPDSKKPAVMVFDPERGVGPNSIAVWCSEEGLPYFAPTGSAIRAGYLGPHRRGNADELIRFNLQVRPWLAPVFGADLIQATPRQGSQVDPGLAGASDVIEVLASHCGGLVFTAPDSRSTVTIADIASESALIPEPAVVWARKSDEREGTVYFLPPGATDSTDIVEPMNSRPGSEEDLRAFASDVLPWLEPTFEVMAADYLDTVGGKGLGD